ncbi:hypothetical protein J2Y91_001429 [Erwinia aphidicola]|nr:hypothetical protein [Erwinia aphidicola]
MTLATAQPGEPGVLAEGFVGAGNEGTGYSCNGYLQGVSNECSITINDGMFIF